MATIIISILLLIINLTLYSKYNKQLFLDYYITHLSQGSYIRIGRLDYTKANTRYKTTINMQLSITLTLSLLPFLGFAIPVDNAIAATAVSLTGEPQTCMENRDGTGHIDRQVTKDCCHHVHQDRGINNVYFNEYENKCMGRGGPGHKVVDWDRMNECCASRGRGAHGWSDLETAGYALGIINNIIGGGGGNNQNGGKTPTRRPPMRGPRTVV